MRLTWKKDEQESGVARTRGSKLHDGKITYARVDPIGGGWQGPVRGWYYVTGWGSCVPHVNTCETLCTTEAEAKAEAKKYVLKCLQSAEKTTP